MAIASFSPNENHTILLRQAEQLAAPYTRRVALRLAAFALLCLAGSTVVAWWPALAQAATLCVTLLLSAVDTVCEFAGYLGTVVAQALRIVGAAFIAIASVSGLAMAAACLVVAAAWHRARTYVMQSAIELLVQDDAKRLAPAEGSALLAAFARTQQRVHASWLVLGGLGLVSAFILLARTGPSWLAFGFVVLAIGALSLVGIHRALAPDRIAAYALFRSCPLPREEFRVQLSDRRDNLVTRKLVRLRQLGLVEDSHRATLRVMHAAKRLAAR